MSGVGLFLVATSGCSLGERLGGSCVLSPSDLGDTDFLLVPVRPDSCFHREGVGLLLGGRTVSKKLSCLTWY